MTTDANIATRLRFLQRLNETPEEERTVLLRLESDAELPILWNLAMTEKLTGVAASIEVHGNGRGQY